jgi:hypothetical protein
MTAQRKIIGALARFPQSAVSRKGKRTHAQWEAERDALAQLVKADRGSR